MSSRVPRCSGSGCANFGASYREGVFCSVHAAEMGLQRPRGGQCWRCEGLARVDAGYGGATVTVGGVELPRPFTQIESRLPVVGDTVVTLVDCMGWMYNSKARVVAVHPESQSASIHLSCDSVANLKFGQFVICGGGERPQPPPPPTPPPMDQVLAHARNFAGAPCDRPQALPVPLTVMSQQVLDELLETFFPNGKHEIVRLNPPLPDTVIREMRDIFLQHLQRDHRDSFTWDDMLMSMYSLVVTHCRITPQIQILGNAKFRSMLCSAFESSVCGLPHDVRACAARDRSLLESAARTIETLCTTQEVELSGKPRDATDDAFVTPHTPAHAVHAALAAVGQPRSAGPAPLLIWDSDTQSLVDRLFEPLFASANPPPSGIISRPLAGQAMSMHESLSAHFGDQALTRDTILHELKLASSGVCVEYLLKPLRCYLERKSQRLCSRIIRFRRPPPPPFPGIPPFPDVDPPVPTIEWPIKFDRSDLPDSVRQTRKWSTDFNEVNFGASFRPFLDASELPDITGSKHGRIAAEHNRCFFIHLGAALNIHPVWLQEDFRRHAHRAILKNQFCQSQGSQPLMDVLKPDQLIDIAILYSYWPDYLRGVKLLFVNCRERHTEGPLIGMEKILPATWTVIKDPGGFHREVVLKLSGNHFTLLQPAVPSLTDPASHLHRLAMEAGFPDPVDISDLIWGPLDGFSPENDDDYQAAVTTVLQWWPDEYFDDEE